MAKGIKATKAAQAMATKAEAVATEALTLGTQATDFLSFLSTVNNVTTTPATVTPEQYKANLVLAQGTGIRSKNALEVPIAKYGKEGAKATIAARMFAQGVTEEEYKQWAKEAEYGISMKKLIKYYTGKGFRIIEEAGVFKSVGSLMG